MPLISVTNLSASEVVISDSDKSFPTINVPALSTKSSIPILGVELERAGPTLARLVTGGLITFTTAQDPAIDDAAENLMGPAAVADLAVTTAKLAALAVTKAKALVFASAELTGTGAAQNVAHGLGVVPALVLVVPTAGHNGAGAAGTQFTDVAEGVHTSTNVVVTVDNGGKFKVLAWG